MDHSGLIWPCVVSWSEIIPGVLPWTIVVSSGHGGCHGLREYLGCYNGP